jgi:hypothetical protein
VRDDLAQFGRKIPARAAVFLKETIDGELGAVRLATGEDEMRPAFRLLTSAATHGHDKAILIELVEIQPSLLDERIAADVDRWRAGLVADGQFRAGHLLDDALEFGDGAFHLGRRVGSGRRDDGTRLTGLDDGERDSGGKNEGEHGGSFYALPRAVSILDRKLAAV